MKELTLDAIKGQHWIKTDGEYVILSGSKLWIFKTDGAFVACRPDLRNVHKVAFLPNRRLLVDGGKQCYHLISMDDGSEIWSAPQPRSMECTGMDFAISPDSTLVYDSYSWKDGLYFVTIHLENGELEIYRLQNDHFATVGLICDEDGVPCLLRTHYEMIGGNQVSQNGVLYQYQDDISIGNTYYWKSKWQYSGTRIAKRFLNNVNVVLTNDLYVHNVKTGEVYSLLENETEWNLPKTGYLDRWLDISGHYLTLQCATANVVLDIPERKVVATYAGEYFKGCIVGKEYWTCVDTKVERKPFPLREPIPEEKYKFWSIAQQTDADKYL